MCGILTFNFPKMRFFRHKCRHSIYNPDMGENHMHDARSVANYLIDKAIDDGRPFTPLQVIKLTYYCHAWMMAMHDKKLIEQPIEAWQYGPVIGDVYRGLRDWGGELIEEHSPIDTDDAKFDPDSDEKDTIDRIYDHYGRFDGIRLSALTHQKGSPWDTTWRGKSWWEKLRKTTYIKNDDIKNYYRKIGRRNKMEQSQRGE